MLKSHRYGYTVALFFEKTFEDKIRGIWAEVAEKAGLVDKMAELNGSRPHISLCVFDHGDEDEVQRVLAVIAVAQVPIEVRFEMVGIFDGSRGIPFLGIACNRRLLDLHAKCYGSIAPLVSGWSDYYLPERLVFHCSINVNLEKDELMRASTALLDTPLPLVTKLQSIGLLHQPQEESHNSFMFDGALATSA